MKDDTSFLNEPKVATWVNELVNSGCSIHSIKPLQLLNKKNKELLFALLEVDATASDGQKLLPYIFIRGNACIIVPLLINKETSQEYYLMVNQRRIAHGKMSLEFPAGMLDRNVSNPKSVAIKELYEETGLKITENQLQPLSDKSLYSSPGASDESIYYYGCIIEMNDNELKSFEGKLKGCKEENEKIIVTLKSKKDAENSIMSTQGRLAIYLFNEKRHILEQHKVLR